MIKEAYQLTVLILYKLWIMLQELQFQIIYLICDFKDTIIDSRNLYQDEEACKKRRKKPKHISLLFNPTTLKTLLKRGSDSGDTAESVDGLVDLILQIINYTKSTNDTTTISLYDKFGVLLSFYDDLQAVFVNQEVRIVQDMIFITVHHLASENQTQTSCSVTKTERQSLQTTNRYISKDKGPMEGRDHNLATLLALESLTKTSHVVSSLPPPPEVVFVIGGFLLEFYSYPPLYMSIAEFCHVRFLFNDQVHHRDIRKGLVYYANSQQRNGK